MRRQGQRGGERGAVLVETAILFPIIPKVNGVISGSYNGQWVTFEVPIPADSTCNPTDPLGCWTRLRFAYPVGTDVSDTTTWSAFMAAPRSG